MGEVFWLLHHMCAPATAVPRGTLHDSSPLAVSSCRATPAGAAGSGHGYGHGLSLRVAGPPQPRVSTDSSNSDSGTPLRVLRSSVSMPPLRRTGSGGSDGSGTPRGSLGVMGTRMRLQAPRPLVPTMSMLDQAQEGAALAMGPHRGAGPHVGATGMAGGVAGGMQQGAMAHLQMQRPLQEWMSHHAARLLLPYSMRDMADIFVPPDDDFSSLWRPGMGMGMGDGPSRGGPGDRRRGLDGFEDAVGPRSRGGGGQYDDGGSPGSHDGAGGRHLPGVVKPGSKRFSTRWVGGVGLEGD